MAKKIEEIGGYELGDSLRHAIESNGFKINEEKFRLQVRTERQVVTGLTVNEKVNLDREYIRLTRAMIDGWGKDKVTAAKKYHKIRHGNDVQDVNYLVAHFRNHIYGRLSLVFRRSEV